MLQEWQLQQYQPAAQQMCVTRGEPPYETVYVEGNSVPRWAVYAQQMSDLALMLQTMRQCGVLPL